MYYQVIVVIVCLVFIIVNVTADDDNQLIVSSVNTYNNHLYRLYKAPKNIGQQDAIQACLSRQGYLITITDRYEWEFMVALVQSSAVGNVKMWVSGTDVSETGNWVFSSGPESGALIYNYFTDICYSYCNWTSGEPNLQFTEHYLAYDSAKMSVGNFNALMYFMCEFDNGNPLLPALSSLGGEIPVNFKGVALANLAFTMTNMVTNQNIPVVVNTDSSILSIGPNVGLYNLTIVNKATGELYSNGLWQYSPPALTSLALALDGVTLSITGSGYGVTASRLSVRTASLGCKITSLSQTMIKCTLDRALSPTETLLPVIVSVDNGSVMTTSFRVAVLNPASSTYYSSISTISTFPDVYTYYIFNNGDGGMRSEGQNGYLAILSNDNRDFFKRTFNAYPAWCLWQPVQYNQTAKRFYSMYGPKAGSFVSVYGEDTLQKDPTWTSKTRFYLDAIKSNLVAVDESVKYRCSLLIQLGGYSPEFTDTSFTVPTKSSTINVGVKHIGMVNDASTFTASSGTVSNAKRNIDSQSVDLTLPDGYQPFTIKGSINNIAFTNSLTIQYQSPSIQSISANANTLTINGSNFYKDAKLIAFTSGSSPCLNVKITVAHQQFTCTLSASTLFAPKYNTLSVGSKTVYYVFGKNYYDLTDAPIVLTSYKIEGYNLTVTGYNLAKASVARFPPGNVLIPSSSYNRSTDISLGAYQNTFVLPPKTKSGLAAFGPNLNSDIVYNQTILLPPVINAIEDMTNQANGTVFSMNGGLMVRWIDNTDTPTPLFYRVGKEDIKPLLCDIDTTNTYSVFLYQNCFVEIGTSNASMISILYAKNWTSKDYTQVYVFYRYNPIIVQSTSLVYQIPGLVNITVKNLPSNLTNVVITIGGSECRTPSITQDDKITCFFNADVPLMALGQSLPVTINNIATNVTITNNVFLYMPRVNCPNPCNNGTCDYSAGICLCAPGFFSYNCLSTVPPIPTRPELDSEFGSITLPGGKQINFTTSVSHIRERNMLDETVKILPMNKIMWVDNLTIPSIPDTGVPATYIQKGIFYQETVIVQISIKIYENDTIIDFAGEKINISANSVKYEISVANWEFNSTTNYLQVIFSTNSSQSITNQCDDSRPTDAISNSNNTSTELQPQLLQLTQANANDVVSSLTWFSLDANGNRLEARFSNRIIVDSRVQDSIVQIIDTTDPEIYPQQQPPPTQTQQPNNIDNINTVSPQPSINNNYQHKLYTSISIPYFKTRAVLDPNFRVLIERNDGGKACKSHANKGLSESKWRMTVIIVTMSVVGVFVTIASVIFLIKRSRFKRATNSLKRKLQRAASSNNIEYLDR
ncbi:hypothetical protein CYY_001001 [Polysphondylium violaceum]|uniref:C-type lectin domain-containing protein n=1 Tax=Polysphondylium violaceum TaxID=133409 RepID=A0A8J4V1Y8_9MYCE|nr:hypothetical protein CYY_001001 [Polysphondylium violaceum]